PAFLADLLVERRPALRLDGLAALLADLLVEGRAALCLDRVAALLADLLVERAAALRLHRLAALAADLLVEGVPVFVANGLPALESAKSPRLADTHRPLGCPLQFECRPLAGLPSVQSGCHLHLPLTACGVVHHTWTAVS